MSVSEILSYVTSLLSYYHLENVVIAGFIIVVAAVGLRALINSLRE